MSHKFSFDVGSLQIKS